MKKELSGQTFIGIDVILVDLLFLEGKCKNGIE